MTGQNDFFTPKEVDEQIEQIVRSGNLNQFQQHKAPLSIRLVHDLRRFYRTNAEEDTGSLQRAWERIENHVTANEKPILPLSNGNRQPVDNLRFQQGGSAHMNSNIFGSPRGKTLQQRIGMVAAIIFLTLLVGSMVVVLNVAHQSKPDLGNRGKPTATSTTVSKPKSTQLNIYAAFLNSVYKLDSKSGKVLWTFPAGNRNLIPASPTVVDGLVYVAEDSYLYALNAKDGSIRWSYPDSGGYFTSTVVDGIAYVSSSDGYLHALDTTTGKERWHYNPGVKMNSMVTVANGIVFGVAQATSSFGSTSFHATLYALDATNGSQRWRKQVPQVLHQFFSQLQVVNGVLYTVTAIDDKDVNPPNRFSYVVAFDAKSGSPLWRSANINEYAPAPLTVVNGVIYLGTDELGLEGPRVYALNANDGKVIWKKAVQGAINSSPQVVDGVVYIGETSNATPGNNNIVALSASGGSILWTHPLPYYIDFGIPMVVNNGTIYVGTLDGIVHALKISTGSELRTYEFEGNNSGLFPPAVTLAP